MSYIKDILSIQESNLAEIPVYNYTHDGKINYVIREMSIDLFMDRHNIGNKELLVNNLKEFYNFYDNLIILKNNDELLKESAYQDIYNALYLYEHIDVEEVKTLSKGYSIVNQMIDKTIAFIKGQHFDEAENIRNYIMRIDTEPPQPLQALARSCSFGYTLHRSRRRWCQNARAKRAGQYKDITLRIAQILETAPGSEIVPVLRYILTTKGSSFTTPEKGENA